MDFDRIFHISQRFKYFATINVETLPEQEKVLIKAEMLDYVVEYEYHKTEVEKAARIESGNNFICAETDHPNFALGKYGNLNILIHKPSGYIHGKFLTDQLLKRENEESVRRGKKIIKEIQLKLWMNGDSFKSITNRLKELNQENNCSLHDHSPVLVLKKDTPTNFRGIYFHIDLINPLACWASPSYCIDVSRIINRYMESQAVKNMRLEIDRKDSKIDTLTKKVDDMLDRFKIQENLLREQHKISKESFQKISSLESSAKSYIQSNGSFSVQSGAHESIIVFKNNIPRGSRNLLYDWDVYVICCQKDSFPMCYKNMSKILPDTSEVLRHSTCNSKINYKAAISVIFFRIKKLKSCIYLTDISLDEFLEHLHKYLTNDLLSEGIRKIGF